MAVKHWSWTAFLLCTAWIPRDRRAQNWYADGFAFWCLKMTGEPNKISKDELMKIAANLKQCGFQTTVQS